MGYYALVAGNPADSGRLSVRREPMPREVA
jgi:hypothetical protein